MTTAIERYREAAQRRKEVEKEVKAQMQEAFGDVAREIFSKHPSITGFAWRQYTPYFNDGEPCVFSAHIDEFTLRASEEFKGQDGEQLAENSWEYNYVYFYGDEDENRAAQPILYPAWRDIQNFLAEFQNDLEGLFGDHVEVWVTPDGVEPEEYDHD